MQGLVKGVERLGEKLESRAGVKDWCDPLRLVHGFETHVCSKRVHKNTRVHKKYTCTQKIQAHEHTKSMNTHMHQNILQPHTRTLVSLPLTFAACSRARVLSNVPP